MRAIQPIPTRRHQVPALPRWPARATPLALVLAAALALRLLALDRAPFWMDEAATAGFAALSWHELLFGLGRLEPNPPAFYAVEKLWTALAGASDLAFRLPSVLFGLGGVALVARLARHAFGPRAALLAAVLMATQAQHLQHSREARVYALLVLAIAAAALAARAVAALDRWRWRPVLALAAAAGGAMLLHATAPLAAACVFLYATVAALHPADPARHRALRLRALATAGAGALLAAAPQLAATLAVMADGANNAAWIPRPGGIAALQLTLSVLAVPLEGIRDWPGPAILAAFAAAAAAAGSALGWGLCRAARDPQAAALLAATLAAILGLFGLSQVVPMMLERTLLFALVFFVPLLAGALVAAPPALRAALLALLLLVQAPAWAVVYGPARHGEDWAGLAARLQRETAATGWPVLVLGGFEALAIDRYLPPGDPARPRLSITPDTGARLTDLVTRRMTSAQPLPEGGDARSLCDALTHAAPGAGGVLLVLRASAILPQMQPRIAARLQDAGGTPAAPVGDRLAVQRWTWSRGRPCLPTG